VEWVTLLVVGKPESWITPQVRTDGFMFRQACLSGEIPALSC